MDPCAGRAGLRADGGGGIECAGVDVAGLKAEDSAAGEVREGVGAHAAVGVDGHADHALAAEAEHAQGLDEGGVRLIADDDGELGRAEEAVVLDVPAGALEKGVAGGGEGAEVGHGGAGNDGARRAGGQAEQIAGPLDGGVFEGDGRGRLALHGGVLVPGADQPGRSHRGRQAAAVDKAEVAASAVGDGGGRAVLGEQAGDFGGIGWGIRQRAGEGAKHGYGIRARGYGTVVDRADVIGGRLGGDFERSHTICRFGMNKR